MAETSQNLGDPVKPIGLNPPITMKVDSPVEEPKQEIDDNEKNASEEMTVCSPSPKLSASSNPFASSQNKFVTRGILKPPQLSLNLNKSTPVISKPSFVLNPSRLNPFARNNDSSSSKGDKTVQLNGEPPKFVPLLLTDTKTNNIQSQTPPVTNSETTSATATNSFVFGQNLQERVVAAECTTDEPKASTSLNSNGTTEMLFSSALRNEVKSSENVKDKEVKSLSESAREYEESRASKRKYEEVEVITGEEGETNILKISCKLFAFDKASGNWQERGRGVLRLNDLEGKQHTQSRLVFRTTGSLRVVLNTKIWAEMTVEQASEKSVRFTALDANGVIKVFLAMASMEDSKHMYSQIQSRVQKEIAAQKHKKLSSEDKDSGGN